uniref:uncharacterized protein LOC122587758 n=1 Tax=Erigeron canadensis TaxID=72917 RepID=UPI001CB97210|nr:uncharacterized protein LOC122587758 [Erigeron canadensis]
MKDGDDSDRSKEVQSPDTLDDGKQLPQATKDPGSFLIPCTINNEYFSSALADLGLSINVMPNAIYQKLTLCLLKPANMSIRLANQTYRQPKWIVERVHVRVKDLEFWTEFVVLDMTSEVVTPSFADLKEQQIAKDKINDVIIQTMEGLLKTSRESIETEKEMGLEVKKSLEAKNKI